MFQPLKTMMLRPNKRHTTPPTREYILSKSLCGFTFNGNAVLLEMIIKKTLLFIMIIWILFILKFISSNDDNHLDRFTKKLESAPKCAQMEPSDIRYTLVTHSSEDRLWMMEHHCRRWGYENNISIAIYTNKDIKKMRSTLTSLGCHQNKITIDIINIETNLIRDYPINQLRNKALSAVKTSHALIIDIDFFESADLHHSLHDTYVKEELALDENLAIVVPAFQLNRGCRANEECNEFDLKRMPYSRDALKKLVMTGMATIFDPTNLGGHGSTDYGKWFQLQHTGLVDLSCIKSRRYEPYVVLRYCEGIPPFQESFTGYGKNKLTWSIHLQRVGYKLKQLNLSFLVHFPHRDSESRKRWNEHPEFLKQSMRAKQMGLHTVNWSHYKRGQVDQLFVDFRKWLSLIPNNSRTPLCSDAVVDDDENLWVEWKNNK